MATFEDHFSNIWRGKNSDPILKKSFWFHSIWKNKIQKIQNLRQFIEISFSWFVYIKKYWSVLWYKNYSSSLCKALIVIFSGGEVLRVYPLGFDEIFTGFIKPVSGLLEFFSFRILFASPLTIKNLAFVRILICIGFVGFVGFIGFEAIFKRLLDVFSFQIPFELPLTSTST